MQPSPLAAHQATPAELAQRLAAERRGVPFLVFRDDAGGQRIVDLGDDCSRLVLGRAPSCDVCLAWDRGVSRLHAELERIGDEWLVVDDGLSSNGTFVRGERVAGRRRLADGDVITLGHTAIAYCAPGSFATTTRLAGQQLAPPSITLAQRRVLVALCRPFKHRAGDAVPATNPQIAAELHLTVAAVKTHLHALFRAFGIDELPQQEKRRKLVALAFASGLLSDRDL
jgi:FHA domain